MRDFVEVCEICYKSPSWVPSKVSVFVVWVCNINFYVIDWVPVLLPPILWVNEVGVLAYLSFLVGVVSLREAGLFQQSTLGLACLILDLNSLAYFSICCVRSNAETATGSLFLIADWGGSCDRSFERMFLPILLNLVSDPRLILTGYAAELLLSPLVGLPTFSGLPRVGSLIISLMSIIFSMHCSLWISTMNFDWLPEVLRALSDPVEFLWIGWSVNIEVVTWMLQTLSFTTFLVPDSYMNYFSSCKFLPSIELFL